MNTISNYPSFKAVKIANTQNCVGKLRTNIEIYKLELEDRKFLQKLAEKTDYKKLCPKLSEVLQERWQKVFNYCIMKAFNLENTTYVAFHDNKPCGILTYCDDGSSLYLDGICRIPDKNEKKIPFVGQTLFLQIFKDAEKKQSKEIKLDAIQDGPFNVVEKYEALGFKKDPTTFPYTEMVCKKYKIKEQLKELPFTISYKNASQERINLERTLD